MTWNAKPGVEEKKGREDFFKPAKELELDVGLKILVWGPPEVGKTFFGLSAPPPIFALSTEFGVAPLLRHFPNKEIYIFEAAVIDPETNEPDANKSLGKIEEALGTLLNITSGTILIDTGTDIWGWLGGWVEQEARRLGRMTRIETPVRTEWGRANIRWRQLILRLMMTPAHFVITAQPQEVYDSSGNPLGEYRPRIQRQTEFMCDLVVHMDKVYEKGIVKPKYISKLTKCRFQRGLDTAIEDMTWDKLCETLDKQLGVKVRR